MEEANSQNIFSNASKNFERLCAQNNLRHNPAPPSRIPAFPFPGARTTFHGGGYIYYSNILYSYAILISHIPFPGERQSPRFLRSKGDFSLPLIHPGRLACPSPPPEREQNFPRRQTAMQHPVKARAESAFEYLGNFPPGAPIARRRQRASSFQMPK